jgi:hypothetical protein
MEGFMTNSNHLNQHLLRTMLLEGSNNDEIIKKIRGFNKTKKTKEDLNDLTGFLRKQVTKTTKELLSDDQITSFVDEVADQL